MKTTLLTSMMILTMALSFGALGHGEEAELITVGNKVCPVGGGKVDSMGGPHQIEHGGKLYNLCCSGCVRGFMSDPEKYTAIAHAEIKEKDAEGY